jgi:hypothetical protein
MNIKQFLTSINPVISIDQINDVFFLPKNFLDPGFETIKKYLSIEMKLSSRALDSMLKY